MPFPELSERERRVLEAVIQSYVETAEPAGSRTISRRFGLGVSPATIRNTMSELEEKGYLFHPHTSAGRVPTDSAYRLYVDSLMGPATLSPKEAERLAEDISVGGSAIEAILRRAAQSLSVVAQELGVALGPRLDRTVLQRLDVSVLANQRRHTGREVKIRGLRLDHQPEQPIDGVADGCQRQCMIIREWLCDFRGIVEQHHRDLVTGTQ